MACKCKNITNVNELKEEIENAKKKVKIPFWTKCKIIWYFFYFHFLYVNTAIINFIVTNRLEPVLSKKLLKKYNSNINEQNLKD